MIVRLIKEAKIKNGDNRSGKKTTLMTLVFGFVYQIGCPFVIRASGLCSII